MTTRGMKLQSLTAITLLSLCCGCVAPVRVGYRNALKTEYGKQAGYGKDEAKWIALNCPLEMPKHSAGADFGNTKVICREGYVLEHSAKDKIPLWVCERVTKAQVSGPLTRPKPEPFAPEPLLKNQRRAELKDYRGSGYDRGHQAPSGDQTVEQALQNQTYFLSNMAPQFAALNQRIWKALEERVRVLALTKGVVYVTTGSLFYDEAEENAATADGYVEYELIGNEVAVPTHFYKIVSWQDDQSKWQAVAFVIKNQKADFPKPYVFDNYTQSVEWIEKNAGMNFMPDLAGPDVKRVEGTKNLMWK